MLILFAASGCAALIYEVVWFQLLQVVIGSSTISLGLLLGTYMGGLCLGSLGFSRLIRAARHPLSVYAILEAGIGAFGLLVLIAVPYVGRMYLFGATSGTGGIFFRGFVCAVCLLPPTLLMGATLPAASRWLESTNIGMSRLGLIYGANIAGAVVGCLVAGFYVLRVFDLAIATYIAVTINIAVALFSFALASRNPYRRSTAHSATPTGRVHGSPAIYLAIGLSGLCALGAQVVWTRQLSLMLGATVYTFSIILAVFLIGLGIGAGLGATLARRTPRPRLALADMPATGGRRSRLDRVHVRKVPALLADRPLAFPKPVVQLPGRSPENHVDDPASHPLMGRKLSADISGTRSRRERIRHGFPAKHTRQIQQAPSLERSGSVSCSFRGSARLTLNRS